MGNEEKKTPSGLMSGVIPAAPNRLTTLQAVAAVVADAPQPARRTMLVGLVAWLVMMVVQGVQSAGGTGLPAAAEFLSALCGSAGGTLLALTGVLNASAEQAAGERRGGDRYRRVLLALPALGLAAGTLLAAAVALMIVRAMLGAELPFVVIMVGLYGVMLWGAVITVTRATRALYAHAQAEADAASAARLSALQARMNPHFLFNALNTVAALVRTEPAAAERVTEDLASVLRMTLDRSAERMSTVAAEVEYLRAWLAVEQERWKERLRLDWAIDPAASAAAVPPLVLQPLVENALRHGLGARIDGGAITVAARRDGIRLLLRVEDDGVGFPPAPVERTGLGNLRQRLAVMYGDAATVTIEPRERGASVVVSVPFQEGYAGAHR